jgi:hypothetical protein
MSQSYEAEYCLASHSAYAADFTPDSLYKLRIDLSSLEWWLNLQSIVEQAVVSMEDGDTEISVRFKDHEFVYESEDGKIAIESATASSNPFLGLTGPVSELTFKQETVLTYEPLVYGFHVLRTSLFRLEDFISLLLGTYLRFDWPFLIQRSEDGFGSWHRAYFLRDSDPELKPNPYVYWVKFHTIKDSFGRLFFAWKTQLTKYGPPYYLYLFELRHSFIYPEHKFVNLMWAIEALHKKLHLGDPTPPSSIDRKARVESILGKLSKPEDAEDRAWFAERASGYQRDPSLEDRMFDCLARLPIVLDTTAVRSFSRTCAQTRHAISHEGEAPTSLNVSLFDLADALAHLYHALLLHEIGFNSNDLRKALTEGGLAELRIIPALDAVGLSVQKNGE